MKTQILIFMLGMIVSSFVYKSPRAFDVCFICMEVWLAAYWISQQNVAKN